MLYCVPPPLCMGMWWKIDAKCHFEGSRSGRASVYRVSLLSSAAGCCIVWRPAFLRAVMEGSRGTQQKPSHQMWYAEACRSIIPRRFCWAKATSNNAEVKRSGFYQYRSVSNQHCWPKKRGNGGELKHVKKVVPV